MLRKVRPNMLALVLIIKEEVYKPSNHVLVFPPDLMTQPAHSAVFPPRFQSQYPERLWYYHPLLLVVWGRDTFENLETFHRSGTTSGLVRYHASDSFVEDAGRSAEVERTCCVRVKRARVHCGK